MPAIVFPIPELLYDDTTEPRGLFLIILFIFGLLGCQEAEIMTTDTMVSQCVDLESSLNLIWPVEGVDAQDWAITNYVDANRNSGTEDYVGNTGEEAKTYDGHKGVDIGVSSFRQMDEGTPVIAAASGEVINVIDGYYDRNTECINYDANMVSVRHSSGHVVKYVHLKTDSTAVSVGDYVIAGDLLGLVGSSGCSDGPHLHFEITSPTGDWLDPFSEGMWCEPPVYDTPIDFMESWLLEGPEDQYDNPWQDPPEEQWEYEVGSTILTYVVIGGGQVGDEAGVTLLGPNGSMVGPWPVIFDRDWTMTTWYWSFIVQSPSGMWTVDYQLNGESVAQQEFEVL